MRTQGGIYLLVDFQVAPTATGVQKSIISVGQVAGRSIIVVRRSGGTIFNERSLDFDRSSGVYRQKVDTPLKRPVGAPKLRMTFEQQDGQGDEAHAANAGAVLVLLTEAEVEQQEMTHLLFPKLVPACSACMKGKGTSLAASPPRPPPSTSLGGVSKLTVDHMLMRRRSRSWSATME